MYFIIIIDFFSIFSVDIADEEPHFVGYSAINHYYYYYYYYYYLHVPLKVVLFVCLIFLLIPILQGFPWSFHLVTQVQE